MSAADYRLMTEATGQRIAAALEALQLTGLGDPVTISHGGTGATTAAGACENIGAVKKAGDTMTGWLGIQNETYQLIIFKNNNGVEISHVRGESKEEGNRVVFSSRNLTTNTVEDYHLPIATATVDTWYDVLTTKSPVTVAQGGTGANNAAGARDALNIYTATRVTTFTNGTATLQFSDVGVTSRPDTVILTPSSGNDIFRYDWDNSANEIKLIAYHPDGSPVNSVARYSILVIP